MTQDIHSPGRDGIDETDETDDRMFTDSFAPREEDPPAASSEDPLEEAEELLPQAEPVEGPATLP